MPLRGDDVQPAHRDDVVVLCVGLVLERLEDALVGLSGHAIEVVEVIEVDELVVVDELRLGLREPFGDLVGERLLAGHELRVAAEQDVGSAARHVRRDRDGGLAPGLRDDLRFLRVILGVQNDVPDAALLEQLREPLGLLDRDRADETGPPFLLLLQDVGDDGFVFLALGAVDGVGLFDALQLAVGRE